MPDQRCVGVNPHGCGLSVREPQKHTPPGGGLALPYLQYMFQSPSLLQLEIPLSHGCALPQSPTPPTAAAAFSSHGCDDPGEDVSIALMPLCPHVKRSSKETGGSGGVVDRVTSVLSGCLSMSRPDETADESSPKSPSVCSISLLPQLFVFASVTVCVCLCLHACSFQSHHS